MTDVAIIGAGYVGVPLAQVFARRAEACSSSSATPSASRS